MTSPQPAPPRAGPFRNRWCNVMTAKKIAGTALLVIAALYTAATVVSVVQHSHFIDDDYENFYLILHNSFWDYIFILNDDQCVPLHRIFTYVIYALLPLNFPFAVAVLLLLHLLAVGYLYRILRLLGDSDVNGVLLFLYATNVFLFVPLLWWSSGVHRFLYVLLATISIYYYLKYRLASDRRYLLVSFAACGAAFFVYSKATLIPFYLLGLDVCLMRRVPQPQGVKRFRVLAPFFGASLLHLIWYRANIPNAFSPSGWDLRHITEFITQSFNFLGEGLFTVVYNGENTPLNALIGVCCLGFFVYSMARARANILIWLVGLGAIGLNFLLIATSPRNVFGLGSVLTHRYYFELVFLVVIFLKLILDNLSVGQALSWFPKPVQIVLQSQRFHLALIVVYASLSFFNSQVLMGTPRYARHNQVKAYMENLSTSVARLKANPPENLAFVDGNVPEYITGFKWKMRPYRMFLQLFKINAAYGVLTENLYTITETGEIERVR